MTGTGSEPSRPHGLRRRLMGAVIAGSAVAAITLPLSAVGLPSAETGESPPIEASIVGGTPATIEDAPWQVLMMAVIPNVGTFYCGGSLINESWVLTAAHCLIDEGRRPTNVYIAAGITDFEDRIPNIPAAEYILHPGYSEMSWTNDIALVRLSSPVVLNGTTTAAIELPIGLPEGWPAVNTPALITGWGANAGDASVFPDQLQQATISVLAAPGGPCVGETLSTYSENRMMCAGDLAGIPAACSGDSGGPAAIDVDGTWYVAGITSHGPIPCGVPNVPDVYTRVTAYVDWILKTMAAGQVEDVTVVGGTAVVAESVQLEAGALVGVDATRLSGPNRYATSVAVSQAMRPQGADVVYLATGTGFADALSASNGLATSASSLLLTDPQSLPPEVAGELARLSPSQVYLIGGVGAISAQVAEQVADIVGSPPVRLSGANRYQTAVTVAQQAFRAGADTVYLATGAGFADALSASAAMGNGRSALLLTEPGGLPPVVADELVRLNPTTVIVIGGASAVSEAVITQVQTLTGTAPPRLGGANRYATAAAVNVHASPNGNARVYLATGQQFPDALSAAQAVIGRRAALLLSERDVLPAATRIELERLNN